jgi:thymidylate synthase (FAD)
METTMESCLILYNALLQKGVAPEQARMVLPQSMMTEWYWSGTLYAFARVCNLRCKPDTQKETQEVANEIDRLTNEAFPRGWKHLRK